MKPIQVYLHEADIKMLKQLALDSDTSVAELIRSYLPFNIDKHKVDRPDISPKQHAALHSDIVPAPLDTIIDKVASTPPQMGFACCLSKKKQCKHWQWDDVQQLLVNSLTGEVVDVSL